MLPTAPKILCSHCSHWFVPPFTPTREENKPMDSTGLLVQCPHCWQLTPLDQKAECQHDGCCNH